MHVKMKYCGTKKIVKLPSGKYTADKTEVFMYAEVSPGDVATFDNKRTLHFVKLARCQDGTDAWVTAAPEEDITVTFKTIKPKAPSRRTSWKTRSGRAKK